MNLKGKGGLQYALSAKPLAAGGEGEIYNINGQPSFVAKLYFPGKANLDKERKLIKMVNEPPDASVLSQIAWPNDVLYNDTGKFVGFVMPKMNTNEELNVIYEYGSAAKYAHMQWDSRIVIAQNLCVVLDSVHKAGHTCGDFNPKNISVDPKTGHIVFLDTDSYHIQDGTETYRCDVGMPEYLASEVQVKMRGGGTLATANLPTFSQDTDNFALAIHIFQLLMNGVHPFACAIIPSQDSVRAPQPIDNIERGQFPFMQKIPGFKIPAFAPEITILPKALQNLFERAFVSGHRNPSSRPNAVEWHTALRNLRNELKTCSNVQHHQYHKSLSSCPWCEVNNRFAQKFQPKSTLTQTTITAPSYTPPAPPIVAPKAPSSSSTSAYGGSSSTYTPTSSQHKRRGATNRTKNILTVTVIATIALFIVHNMFGGLGTVFTNISSTVGGIFSGGTTIEVFIEPSRYSIIQVNQFCSEGLIAVYNGNNWSFIDRQGNVIVSISPEYHRVWGFQEGLAQISISGWPNDTVRFIDAHGNVIIDLSDRYNWVGNFADGLAVVRNADGLHGFIDRQGNEVIPARFRSASSFSEGLAAVSVDGRLGFIDTQGNVVIQPRFDSVYGSPAFVEGRAAVAIGEDWQTRRWGFIDRHGNEVVPLVYERVHHFSEGLAAIHVDGLYGYIDIHGNVVIPPRFSRVALGGFSDGLVPVIIDTRSLNDRWMIINQQGREVATISSQFFTQVKEFSDGLAVVRVGLNDDNRHGVVDTRGNLVLAPSYDSIGAFFNGVAAFRQDGIGMGLLRIRE